MDQHIRSHHKTGTALAMALYGEDYKNSETTPVMSHLKDKDINRKSLSDIRFEGGYAMLKKSLIVFPIFLLVLSAAFPQGKGGGGKGQGQGQGMGQGQGQGQGQGGQQAMNAQMEQKRIKTTTQQREQIRSCDKLADDIRKQTRKMAKDSGKNLNTGQLNQQQVHVRNQIRKMEQEHAQLMNGLDANQRQAWQEQIRSMSQLHQQLNLQQQQLDDELKGNPDAKRVAERAQQMERTMNEWRKQYGVLSSQAEF
jgi:hypothetical protein